MTFAPSVWPYALPYGDRRHNTRRGYNLGCRCPRCRELHRLAKRQGDAERAERLAADPTLATHGNCSTYSNWKCRCGPCTAAYSVYNAADKARRRLAT